MVNKQTLSADYDNDFIAFVTTIIQIGKHAHFISGRIKKYIMAVDP